METEDARTNLRRLALERGDDYASLSRLIGRNSAYIQQFIARGSPRRLAETDRLVLAEYFGVDESILGAPDRNPDSQSTVLDQDETANWQTVSRYAVDVSAGPGAIAEDRGALSQIAFPERWLRSISGGDIGDLSIVSVHGDSMEPTLSNGDGILVNRNDGAERLRDGIYVMRVDDALIVKRIAMNPASRRFTIKSDNADYQDWPDCDLGDIDIIGRIVWVGRSIA